MEFINKLNDTVDSKFDYIIGIMQKLNNEKMMIKKKQL
jgi:hypothetical protein